jgi:hypothetical protein
MPRKDPGAVRITSAGRSHSEDIRHRQRRYLISMGIRTACFVAAIFSIGYWFLWVFIIASFVLPYVAVVAANAGAPIEPDGPEAFDPERKAIEGQGGK